MSRPPVSPKPLTGGKVLAMLLAFFGVVIGVNMIMMRLAIQTMPGTEVDSARPASRHVTGRRWGRPPAVVSAISPAMADVAGSCRRKSPDQ